MKFVGRSYQLPHLVQDRGVRNGPPQKVYGHSRYEKNLQGSRLAIHLVVYLNVFCLVPQLLAQ